MKRGPYWYLLILLFTMLIVNRTVLMEKRPSIDAPPLPPARFYGTLTLDGSLAPDGTAIDVMIDGVVYATTTVFTYQGQGGLYLIDVPADDPATPPKEGGQEGDIVAFAVTGYSIPQTGIWQSGAVTILNLSGLSISASSTPTPSHTLTPTYTLTPTFTPTLKVSPTYTFTPAPISSLTLTIPPLHTTTITSTATFVPMLTPSPTSTGTLTATLSPTSTGMPPYTAAPTWTDTPGPITPALYLPLITR